MELQTLHDQLFQQELDLVSRSINMRNALRRETNPLETQLHRMDVDLYILEHMHKKLHPDLTPKERESKAQSLRQSIQKVDAELKEILRDVIKVEELQKDIRGTVNAVSSTQTSFSCFPEQNWQSFFRHVRSYLSKYEEPEKNPDYGKWGSSSYILIEDVWPGGRLYEPPGPRFVELEDTDEGQLIAVLDSTLGVQTHQETSGMTLPLSSQMR